MVKGHSDLLDNSELTNAEFATACDIEKKRADPLVGISEVEYSGGQRVKLGESIISKQ